jgi:hypothetical protein
MGLASNYLYEQEDSMRQRLAWIIPAILLLYAASPFAGQSRAESDQTTGPMEGVPTDGDSASRYRLFHTKNVWTLIELETATGRAWQVRFSLDEHAEKIILNKLSFLPPGADPIPGRFTLYPTRTASTFILLDREDGRTWQLQWSMDAKERGIQRIISLAE